MRRSDTKAFYGSLCSSNPSDWAPPWFVGLQPNPSLPRSGRPDSNKLKGHRNVQ